MINQQTLSIGISALCQNAGIFICYGSLLSLQFVSEQLIFFHKRRDIHMNNSAAMLNQIVPSDYIFRIVIFDAFQWPRKYCEKRNSQK